MPDELPSDVRAVLTQLFDATEAAIEAGSFETAHQLVETAGTVSRNKLPEGDRRDQLCHGCDRVATALATADGVEPDVAAEYTRAIARRLPGVDE